MRTSHKAKMCISKIFQYQKNKITQNEKKQFVIRQIASLFMPCVLNKLHLSGGETHLPDSVFLLRRKEKPHIRSWFLLFIQRHIAFE